MTTIVTYPEHLSNALAGDHYWPNLRRHIKGNAQSELPIKGTCPVCYEDLSICSLPSTTPAIPHPCVILPCGHVLCRPCFQDIEEHSPASKKHKHCPMCALSLQCRDCSAPATCVMAPPQNMPACYAARIPKTVPEGGKYDDICMECTGKQEWLQCIKDGIWPDGSKHMEVGLLPFVYKTLHDLDLQGVPLCQEAVEAVVRRVLDEEFEGLMKARDAFIVASMQEQTQDDEYRWFDQ